MIQCHDNVWPNPALTPLPPRPQIADVIPPAVDEPETTEALNQRTPPPLVQSDDFEWLLLL